MCDYHSPNKLLGKKVVSYELEPTGEHLKLTFDDGSFAIIHTDGECCSYTWIEDMDTPENLKGIITAVENLRMPDLGNVDGVRFKGVGEVQYYGLKIVTDKGHCTIDYRNSSNGYYGGSVYVVMNQVVQ